MELTLTIGNRGRSLRARPRIPVAGGWLHGAQTSVPLVGDLAAIVGVLAVAVGGLGVMDGPGHVLAEALQHGFLLDRRRTGRWAAAVRLLAALVIVDARLVLGGVVLLDRPAGHATLHHVSLRELLGHGRLRPGLLVEVFLGVLRSQYMGVLRELGFRPLGACGPG